MGQSFRCSVGRGGIGIKKREGDGVTPVGSFALNRVLFRPDRVRTVGTAIGLNDVWSDDPKDPNYNRLQRVQPYPYSHERLWRPDPLYDLVGELDFNTTNIEPGGGSAIFLHIWRKPRHPTEGCIAFAKADLEKILRRWTLRSRIVVRA